MTIKKKYAAPLTNNDIIRVVLPNKLNNIIEEARNNNKNKLELIDKISDQIDAKKAIENQLQQIGMHIINAGGVSQDGSTQKDGKPTVIALVEGYVLPGSIQNKTYMWEVPAVTDMMGNAIATQTDAKIVTYITYMYMIKLIRIKDKNDSHLYCNNSTKTLGLCLAPTMITNNSIIFESNGSFRTFKNDKVNPFAVINRAIFYNYPQMTGKKHVFFPSAQDHVPDIEKVINIPISQ